jgi:hypothetical protein
VAFLFRLASAWGREYSGNARLLHRMVGIQTWIEGLRLSDARSDSITDNLLSIFELFDYKRSGNNIFYSG